MASLSTYREKSLPRGLSHRVPLLLPGLLAVLGATYPYTMLFAGAIGCALAALGVATLRLLMTRNRRTGRLRAAGVLKAQGVPFAVILMSLGLIAGICRGIHWDRRSEVVARLAAAGRPLDMTLISLDRIAPSQGRRKVTFRAIAWIPESEIGWFGVEASAYASDVPAFAPGTPVKCVAELEMPLPAMNPGGFDHRGYLLGDRVLSLADIRGVLNDSTGEPAASPPLGVRAAARLRSSVKARIEAALDAVYPASDAAVLKGVFLGDRRCLAPEDSRDFRVSGFYRFIAVSGFHIELLSSLCEKALRRLTRRPSLSRCGTVLAAFGYGSLSGWTPGVIRALISTTMRLSAPSLRMKYRPVAGMGSSALAISLLVPEPLHNTGFMLSFTGAAGAWLGSIYADMVPRHGKRNARPAASAVRAATISLALFPVMASCFAEVSPASFVMSGIWGSVAALTVPMAAVTVLVPGLGAILGWLPYILLQGIRTVSHALSQVPIAAMSVPSMSAAEITACWALLALPLMASGILGRNLPGEEAANYFRRHRALALLRRLVLIAAPAVLFAASALRLFAPWPEITFLYVGQGDCAVIRHRSCVMVVDTGTAAAFDKHVLPYLRAKGITRVDLCVISHLHSDHDGGLPGLLRNTAVGQVAVTPGYSEQIAGLVKSNTPPGRVTPECVELIPGDYTWAGIPVRVVLPDGPGLRGRAGDPGNDSSLVFVLDFCEFRAEFWGDSPSSSVDRALEGNRWLAAPKTASVVKIPHHGSDDAYHPMLYRRLGDDQPLYSVISVGPNSYGHPSKEVEQAAGETGHLRRTDRSGAVTVKQLFGRLQVSSYR